ncbi:MAG TPA: chemotaxis protein CheB [Dongiaceae bacterium]|nr:chemotaxis protein CheB [Dongiaceae bacterium]
MAGTQHWASFGDRSTTAEEWSAGVSAEASAGLIVIGLAVSTSGAEDCCTLLSALPAKASLSIILVQQFDAERSAIDIEALKKQATLTVQKAEEGAQIAPGQLYIAPQGSYLSVADGTLHYASQSPGQAAALPFDLLLQSLAQSYGARAAGVILSGPGADGAIGILAIRERGGLVIVQDPLEASHSDMPRSAITSGTVDLVLPLNRIPAALVAYGKGEFDHSAATSLWPQRAGNDYLLEIADLIHARIAEGFIRPQPGILRRAIQLRMAMLWPQTESIGEYLGILRSDAYELGQLAADIIGAGGFSADGQHRNSAHDDASATHSSSAASDAEQVPATRYPANARTAESPSLGDLQNILNGMDVPMLFLDRHLRLRFFTSLARSLFDIPPDHHGAPVSEIDILKADDTFLAEARLVLSRAQAVERQITGPDGALYLRRISPHRRHDGGITGIIVNFSDITQLMQTTKKIEAAEQQAEIAMATKSHLLAAASHDLRQPLQTLALLQGLLVKTVNAPGAQELLTLLDETLTAMSGMLTTLLNINRIEAGAVQLDVVSFPINDILNRLRNEFLYHARRPQHDLRVVSCGLSVSSDRQLLEQIIRNFLSNAVKYTPNGKLLLGCRRHGEMLRIEVWDTGIGIPETELEAIFEEYRRQENQGHHPDRGMGLGLAIVRRLGSLLNHRTGVRSWLDKGSVFFVEVPIAQPRVLAPAAPSPPPPRAAKPASERRAASVLVVEGDADTRELLQLSLQNEGLQVTAVADGLEALARIADGLQRPDLVLTDYSLPVGPTGLQLAAEMRARFDPALPVAVLAANLATDVSAELARHDCLKLDKPVRTGELRSAVQRLLPAMSRQRPGPGTQEDNAPFRTVIYVVDDDGGLRASLRRTLEEEGRDVEDYGSAEAFLAGYRPEPDACLLVDAYLPGMSGLDLLRQLRDSGHNLPAIMITGNSDVPMAVQAMKTGAFDFIEKPVGRTELLASVDRALEQSKDANRLHAWRATAARHIASLSPRQQQIMAMVLAGQPSKIIAANLGISQRTVESHRATIMKKTGCKSLPELARLALAAISNDPDMALTQYGFPKEILEQLSR